MDKYLIANWKCYKTYAQAQDWLETFISETVDIPSSNVEVIICPPLPFIPGLHRILSEANLALNVSLGAQSISSFDQGPYTGEVSAQMCRDWVSACLVGHSEERELRQLTDSQIIEKMRNIWYSRLLPIVCVSEFEQVLLIKNAGLEGPLVFAYEPLEAISKGGRFRPSEPSVVSEFIAGARDILENTTPILYGGSVNEGNAASLLVGVDGLLVGQASLDPTKFVSILKVMT